MQVEILSHSYEETQLVLKNTNPAFANSLRRIMIAEVPTVAIEAVEITQNDSPLIDEMICHRLGLIPLQSDHIDLVFPQDCDCSQDACDNCAAIYKIDVHNTTNKPMNIYSKHIMPINSAAHQHLPVFDNVIITTINPNSRLSLT